MSTPAMQPQVTPKAKPVVKKEDAMWLQKELINKN